VPTFQGAIFDVDGVLVDSPHEKAWRESLRQLMESDWSDIRSRTSWSPEAFTSRVYGEQISGKPRMSGARAALAYFHVPDDDGRRLAEYADRKQAMVVRLIEAGDFTAYPDALRFIIAVKDAGIGGGGRLLLQERQAVPAADQARQLRAGARDRVRVAATRADAARVLRRRRVRPGFRTRKATSGDVPHRSA
jgi:beta-phosphoglucomutase-like phosphatase (HAD superfamily)